MGDLDNLIQGNDVGLVVLLFIESGDMLNTSPVHFSSYSREKIFLNCVIPTLSPILY